MIIRYEREDELYHHGIPGMKWYRRRFQNEDGSYTALGKVRYGIGQKGRETGKMMSDWSRRMTSKEASNASKMHATPSGKSYFDNAHMLYNGNVRKTARSLMDEYAQASRKNGQPVARASKPSMQYAYDRMRTMARSINGNDEARAVAARSQFPGEKMRNWNDRLSGYMWNYTTKNPEQGARAREKAFTPVMSRSDNAKLYLQGAKNLAGNYVRNAKEGAVASALAAKNGLQYRAQEAAGNARKGAGAFGEIMKAYGKEIGGNANSAIARYLDAANKRAMSDGSSAPSAIGRAENAADAAAAAFRNRAGNAFRRGMATIGATAGINANVLGQKIGTAVKNRTTGDPGEDRYQADPTARSGYDRRIANAIGWATGRKQAAANAAANAESEARMKAQSSAKADIAKYQKQFMNDVKAQSGLSGDRISYHLARSGYGGQLPFKLEFGNESVTSNPMKSLYDYNNAPTRLRNVTGTADERLSDARRLGEPNNVRLAFGDQTYAYKPISNKKSVFDAQGSDEDRRKAYIDYVTGNSRQSSDSPTSAVNRMRKLEQEMNAYRDNKARATIASDPLANALFKTSPNARVISDRTNYFDQDRERRDRESRNRENYYANRDKNEAMERDRRYNEASRYADEHTSRFQRDAGYRNEDAFRSKLNELMNRDEAAERRATKIPPWVAEKYGTSKSEIPSYIWEVLKKRR